MLQIIAGTLAAVSCGCRVDSAQRLKAFEDHERAKIGLGPMAPPATGQPQSPPGPSPQKPPAPTPAFAPAAEPTRPAFTATGETIGLQAPPTSGRQRRSSFGAASGTNRASQFNVASDPLPPDIINKWYTDMELAWEGLGAQPLALRELIAKMFVMPLSKAEPSSIPSICHNCDTRLGVRSRAPLGKGCFFIDTSQIQQPTAVMSQMSCPAQIPPRGTGVAPLYCTALAAAGSNCPTSNTAGHNGTQT